MGEISEKTRVPLGTAVTVAVAIAGWAVSLAGVYYRLEARIESVRVELSVDDATVHRVQDERIRTVEGDLRTIKQATCALARQQRLLVAGCNE